MALTNTEKSQVRLYLGFPDAYRYKHVRLESVLENVSPEAETQVRGLLTKLSALDTYINTTSANGSAGVKKVDVIEFFQATSSGGSLQLTSSKAYGRHFVNQLSIILGVPIENDYFGGSGYGGDAFLSGNSGWGPGRLG